MSTIITITAQSVSDSGYQREMNTFELEHFDEAHGRHQVLTSSHGAREDDVTLVHIQRAQKGRDVFVVTTTTQRTGTVESLVLIRDGHMRVLDTPINVEIVHAAISVGVRND